VLGPSDLYKLVKEIGKFIQNIRTLGTDLSTTFENNMESTLQLDELRKAQRELNDAFSFRRSINVDADADAFSVQAGSAQQAEAGVAVAGTTTAAVAASSSSSSAVEAPAAEGGVVPKKKIRRRVRRKPAVEEEAAAVVVPAAEQPPAGNVPDLEMPSGEETSTMDESTSKAAAPTPSLGISKEEAAKIDEEFDQYVNLGSSVPPAPSTSSSEANPWFGGDDVSSSSKTPTTAAAAATPEFEAAAQSRFQQQLSGTWNDQVLAAGDKLEPMAVVMNKIALLEREKKAALQRLEDEFAQRNQLEQEYYEEQRKLLEEAATQVQNAAFGLEATTSTAAGSNSSSSSSSSSDDASKRNKSKTKV